MLRFSVVVVIAPFTMAPACAWDPLESLPAVAARTGGAGAELDWPWCKARIPPLSDCGEFGSVSDIGGAISEQDVCLLVGAMREWLAERKWDKFQNVRVCRTSQWVVPPNPGETISFDRPKAWITHIIADIPEHSMRLWVFLKEESGEITFDLDAL